LCIYHDFGTSFSYHIIQWQFCKTFDQHRPYRFAVIALGSTGWCQSASPINPITRWKVRCISILIYISANISEMHPSARYLNSHFINLCETSGSVDCRFIRWPAQWAGKIKSCAVIGHPNGQDGAIFLAWDYPQEKSPRKPYNKSFIDQACSVKIAGYWPRSFLRGYGLRLRLGS